MVLEYGETEEDFSIIMSFEQPCVFYRRLHSVGVTHDSGRRWTDRKTWYRQTEITTEARKHRNSPIELRNRDAVIDIGMFET